MTLTKTLVALAVEKAVAFVLRPYQEDAVQAVITHVKKRLSPCLLELATGAGKSLIVAELAKFFAKAAPNKRVLCIAPSKELVEQNAEKYELTGNHASIFCASAGKKCLRAQVIFASPQSALGTIQKIAHMGISAIIIDEAHGMTNTLKKLIEEVLTYEINNKVVNDKCRIIGMTATPYRMGSGYIYAIDATGENELHHDESKAIEPFFSKLLYKITAGELVNDGYLSQVKIGECADSYDTSALVTNNMGKFNAKSVEKVFSGNSKTERIVNAIIDKSVNCMGVMIFASTISHAEEILGYLPDDSQIVTGKLKKSERVNVIESFKAQVFKYIVNVDILTTGFDAPHVDHVAVMRATESASLFQQIIGRGLRLHDEKEFCLISDYAENIERHSLQSDIFTPEIKAKKKAEAGEEITVICPACNAMSDKKRRNDPMYTGLQHDRFGNFLVAGTEQEINGEYEGTVLTTQVLDPSTKDDFGDCEFKEIPVPAHYSRRCSNPEAYIMSGKPVACEHRYSFKTCPDCLADNDIAARHCSQCKKRLVDPNEKLTEKAGQAGVIATGEIKIVACAGAKYEAYESKAGNFSLKVVYSTEIGAITAWHTKKQHWVFNRLAKANGSSAIPNYRSPEGINEYSPCNKWTVAPDSIKIKKTMGLNGYAKFEVRSVEFNKKEDETNEPK